MLTNKQQRANQRMLALLGHLTSKPSTPTSANRARPRNMAISKTRQSRKKSHFHSKHLFSPPVGEEKRSRAINKQTWDLTENANKNISQGELVFHTNIQTVRSVQNIPLNWEYRFSDKASGLVFKFFFFYRAKALNWLHVMTKIYCLFIEANLLFISTNSKYDKCLQEAQPTRHGFMLRYTERTHWRLSFSHTAHRSTAVPNRSCSGSIQKPQAEAVTCCPLYSHLFPASEVSR